MSKPSLLLLALSLLLSACGGGSSSDSSSGGGGSSGDTSGSSTSYTISGTVTGLSGSGLVLQNSGTDDLAVSADGSFTFATSVVNGDSYAVTVKTEPSAPSQGCSVRYGSGTVSGGDVTNVKVTCTSGRYNIVDTAQNTCYDSSSGATSACGGTGYDADYTGNAPSYSASSDGRVVKDNVTGLVWTQSTDTDGNGTVDYSDKMYLADAETYCAGLDLDGYSWRLPSVKELYSLILFTGSDASTYSGTDTSVLTPFIDPAFDWAFGDQSAGDRIIDGQYATSTRYVSTTMLGNATMFGVNFVDGRIKGYPYDLKVFYVRCVAGSSSYGSNDFVDNGDDTVSDDATGLMWEKNDRASLDWDSAVAACESATTGGYSDWRLPNAKELQSIVDYTRSPDTDGSAAIDPVFNTTAIVNEGGQADWSYYWSSTTHAGYDSDGVDNDGTNAVYLSFGRALGYFDAGSGAQLMDVHGAGAQRSDNKLSAASVGGALTANLGYGTFYYHGPQGDILRSEANMARCVR